MVGDLTKTTDRDGRVILYGYDADGRKTTETWVGSSPAEKVTMTYDAAGRLTQIQDANSKYAYTYDDANQLLTVDDQGTTGLPQVTLTYGYDSAGNRTSLDDSLGGLTSYAYDARNELTSLSQSGSGVASKLVKYTYDNNGNMTALDRYGDLTGTSKAAGTTYAYDNAERLDRDHLQDGRRRDDRLVRLHPRRRQPATQEVRTWSGGSSTDTLTYTLHRRRPADLGVRTPTARSRTRRFSYDANGNRDSTGYSTGTDNRISSDGTYTYAYDNEGNLTAKTEIATATRRSTSGTTATA